MFLRGLMNFSCLKIHITKYKSCYRRIKICAYYFTYMVRKSKLKTFLNEAANLVGGGLGATLGYNMAGFTDSLLDISDVTTQRIITTFFLTVGGFVGYSARSFFQRNPKSFVKRARRAIARNRTLAELVKDYDFMNRHGISKGDLGITKKVLQYALTVPFGGALGYLPGVAGVTPLCFYFGEMYNWDPLNNQLSGAISGSILGAWSFSELAEKRKYEKLYNTIGALVGVNMVYFAARQMHFQIDTDLGLWKFLGLEGAGAIAGGVSANNFYNYLKKLKKINH